MKTIDLGQKKITRKEMDSIAKITRVFLCCIKKENKKNHLFNEKCPMYQYENGLT